MIRSPHTIQTAILEALRTRKHSFRHVDHEGMFVIFFDGRNFQKESTGADEYLRVYQSEAELLEDLDWLFGRTRADLTARWAEIHGQLSPTPKVRYTEEHI